MRTFVRCATLVAAAALPTVLAAQSWRTFDISRQQRDTMPMSVRLMYGAGRLQVTPGAERNLFEVHMRYDAERADPFYRFDAATRALELGVRNISVRNTLRDPKGHELNLALTRTAPLDLDLEIGAAEADLDLSGVRIEELRLRTGASDTRVRFDAPNPSRLRELSVEFGAASVQMNGLGNANAERIAVSFGVGRIMLDFSGEWRNSVEMSLSSALGEAVLRVPSDVGVRVETSTFLHSLDAPGLVKRDGAHVSSNWETAKHKLRIRASGALGRLEVTRTGRVEVEKGS
jgi:hypothetical protein